MQVKHWCKLCFVLDSATSVKCARQRKKYAHRHSSHSHCSEFESMVIGGGVGSIIGGGWGAVQCNHLCMNLE